jgi:hypothetical protein
VADALGECRGGGGRAGCRVGRRVYVRSSFIDDKKTSISRYGWKGPIRIGDMKYGSGNATVARVTGDDQVQLWGQWHFSGQCVGMLQVSVLGLKASLPSQRSALRLYTRSCRVEGLGLRGGGCVGLQGCALSYGCASWD